MRNAPPDAGRILRLLAAFVATSIIGGVLAAGLAMPAVGASGAVARNSVEFFDSLPGELEQRPLSEKSRVLAADGTPIADFYEDDRTEVPLDQIAPVMQQAIVAIEDSRFFQHGGVDPKGLIRAFAINQAAGSVQQGASTLTQQYVKNVLIENARLEGDEEGILAAREQSNSRKLKEIKLAISLEKRLSKQEILNRYLNISLFGDRAYGVEAAAKYFFNKKAKDLNLPEAALLAGMVQRPTAWNPILNPGPAKERRNVVLGRMRQLGMIDEAAYQQAKASEVELKVTKPKHGCANAGAQGFYCDYIQNLIAKNDDFKALGDTPEKRLDTLKRGGLTITTTMDTKVQKAAWDAVSTTIPPKDKSKVDTAAVTIEPGTGKVLAIAINKLYNPSGERGTTATNYATDFEYGGSEGFQTGSTFKPFTLATWLKEGKSLNAYVNASKYARPRSSFKTCIGRLTGDPYSPSNSEGGGSGSMSVLNATFNSVNTAYVSMEQQLNLCDIAETAESMGVQLAKPLPEDRNGRPCPDTQKPGTRKLPRCIPSLTLGVASSRR